MEITREEATEVMKRLAKALTKEELTRILNTHYYTKKKVKVVDPVPLTKETFSIRRRLV